MKKRTQTRLASIVGLFIIVSMGVYFILSNLEDNIVFFYPPSDIEKITNAKTKIRVGGLVKENLLIVCSLKRQLVPVEYPEVTWVGLVPTTLWHLCQDYDRAMAREWAHDCIWILDFRHP